MRIFWQSYVDETIGAGYLGALRSHLAKAALPGTTVDVHGISPPNSYAHPLMEHRCARAMIANAVRAEEEGYDAFVIGHFQDSGLLEARTCVDIPVLSLGEASLLHACQLGARIGVVTINPRFVPWIRRQVRAYGLEHRVTGISAITFEPGEIMAAFDDPARFDACKNDFDAKALPLVEDGCDVIVSGGGIPMLLFGRVNGHRIGEAPVLDGLPVTVMAAETAVRLKNLNGLRLSRTGEQGKAPAAVIAEFLAPSR
ncbi:MAG: aspartate/glutamate racemase family protein [Pseudomonadota bacterium]